MCVFLTRCRCVLFLAQCGRLGLYVCVYARYAPTHPRAGQALVVCVMCGCGCVCVCVGAYVRMLCVLESVYCYDTSVR